MLKSILYSFFIMMAVLPALGQQLTSKTPEELRVQLQESKPDSNRVLLLHALARTYLNQIYNGHLASLMDTALGILDHANRLCDTLQLKSLRYAGMLSEGEAWIYRGDSTIGKKRFFDMAAMYHKMGDYSNEAYAWHLLAIRIKHKREDSTEIKNYFSKAIALSKQSHNVNLEASVRTNLASYLTDLKQYTLAEQELLRALHLLQQNGENRLAYIYYYLSAGNRYRGNYEKSLLYATKCVENAERYDSAMIDRYYGELALVYDELGRPIESCQWYRKSIEERIKLARNPVVIFLTAGFLVRQLIKIEKGREALDYMNNLVKVLPPQSPFEKGAVAQNFAYCFDALKQYSETEKNFLAMLAYYKDSPRNAERASRSNMDVGKFYLQRRQFEKAHVYLDTALVYSWDDRLLDQKELYKMLFTADSALGNNAAAIKDLQQYQFINDSIYNERKSRQIEELTIQYETQKKEQSIRLLEKEKALQKNELTKEQNTKRWIVGATLLLIVIIGLLVNYSRLKQRTNQKLQVQQDQIEKKNISLQDLVAEKEWLVREIHHRVKNNFHMVMGLLHTQAAFLQSEEAIQAVTESSQRIQAMSLVHQKLYQSENLSAINMVDYLHELIDYLKDSFHTGNAIRFNLQVDPVTFTVSYCVPVGLIVNEAVTNAIKHAFPDKQDGVIDISLKRVAEDHFLLIIKDNGVGLPATFDAASQTTMGMRLMRGLSDDLDATFQISNNNGTQIKLDFTREA